MSDALTKAQSSRDEATRELTRFSFAATGASFLAVIQLLSLHSFDMPLTVSLYCFAIAIPANIAAVALLDLVSNNFLIMLWYLVSLVIFAVGVWAIFCHFSYTLAVAFFISGAFGGILRTYIVAHIRT
jgi:hypothetical protein